MSNLLACAHIETPVGGMIAGATDAGLCLLEFLERPDLEGQFNRLRRHGWKAEEGESPLFGPLRIQLNEYFEGSRQEFSLPLHTPGSEFQQAVWRELRKIPFGTTRSYKEQALALGDLQAIRAVAAANGANRIAIIIPCHRVIGADGKLVGYAGGLWRKQWLLNHERRQLALF